MIVNQFILYHMVRERGGGERERERELKIIIIISRQAS